MEEGLTLARATHLVACSAVFLDLCNVTTHLTPTFYLALIFFRNTSSFIVATVPLKPAPRIMLFVDPTFLKPIGKWFGGVYFKVIKLRIVTFGTELGSLKPRFGKLFFAVVEILAAKDPKLEHLWWGKVWFEGGIKIFPRFLGKFVAIVFLHRIVDCNGLGSCLGHVSIISYDGGLVLYTVMTKLILLRHGQSTWNKENRFSGWIDVPLTETGEEEAREAGQLLKEKNISFDVIFTSYLKRAQQTLEIVLRTMGYEGMVVHRSWCLNERHYGALQGLNKKKVTEKYGQDKVLSWRRGWEARPPALRRSDGTAPHNDPLYAEIPKEKLPLTESLKDALGRIEPYWHDNIFPNIRAGRNVLVVAHGNSLRAIVKNIDGLTNKELKELNLPFSIPLVYEFDAGGNKKKSYYLGNETERREKEEEIRKQAALD